MAVVAVATLSAEEVIRIHYVLCQDFAAEEDPIGYGGVKSQHLLESAILRQHAGYGSFLKYPEPVSNAATLTFGICCDHAFHNGNKRTALVSMLAHLDKNHLALKGSVRQAELYNLMIQLASRTLTLGRVPPRQRRRAAVVQRDADHQVAELAKWLENRVDRVTRGEKPVTYRQLPQLLKPHGFRLGRIRSNSVEILKEQTVRRGVRRREETEWKPIGRIGYHSDGEEVAVKTMKELRRMCKLTEEDGCDTASFYDGADVIDVFVNRYRTVLRRLEKT